MSQSRKRNPIRISLLWKITVPFVLLAFLLGLGATYLIGRVLNETDQTRFLRQLVDSGQQAADAVVRAEAELLEIERLIANTEGVAEAVEPPGDAEALRNLVLPLYFNAGTDLVSVLDTSGTSLLAIRADPQGSASQPAILRGEAFYQELDFVQRVLQGQIDELGDKHVGLADFQIGERVEHALVVAGPLIDTEGRLVGSVLVGQYLESLTGGLAQQAGANVSLYRIPDGSLLSTTLEPEDPAQLKLSEETLGAALAVGEQQSPVRDQNVAGSTYWEVLAPFSTRSGSIQLGVMGVSLLRVSLDTAGAENRLQVVQFGAVALALILLIGFFISNSITRPLTRIAEAAANLAEGDLEVRVAEGGGDEIGVLARAFNRMVTGLREGSVYRDLLGRAVTPEVREQLRATLAEGGMLLRGQEAQATILFADLRGFTSLAERAQPAEVMATLNAYFSGLVPILARHGGVVNKFDGDAVMAFFGILPQPLPSSVSAVQATHAGIEILGYVRHLNRQRSSQELPVLEIGIGLSTGRVIAGGLGSEDRLQYTVIGDTVNTAQRIQTVTRDLGATALVVSEDTYRHMGDAAQAFTLGRRGLARLKGKQQEVTVIEIRGLNSDYDPDATTSALPEFSGTEPSSVP